MSEARKLTTEELERILDERDRQHRALSRGRALGSQANKARADECRGYWLRTAKRLKSQQPSMTLEDVAYKVRDAALQAGFTVGDDRPHKARTIYRYLSAYPELRDRPITRQAVSQSQATLE